VSPSSGCSDPTLPEGAFCITGYATAPGEVIIHPISYRDKSDRMRVTSEVRFLVSPSPVDHDDIAGSLERLRQSGLTDIVLTAEAPAEAFVGEVVTVQYFAWGRTERVYVTGEAGAGLKKEILRDWYASRDKSLAILDGRAVWKMRVGKLSMIVPEPGEVVVPAARFQCEDAARAWMVGPRGSSHVIHPKFRRTTNAVNVNVKPSPAEGHLVGPVQLRTESLRRSGPKNWTFTVEATGAGALAGIDPPRFVSRPDVPVLVRPLGPVMDTGSVHQRWHFIVHSDKATKLPDIELQTWDKSAGKLTSVRVKPPLIPNAPPRPARAAPPPAAVTDPPDASTIEATAILMFLLSLFVFVRIVVD
jgi:hypothetical protein